MERRNQQRHDLKAPVIFTWKDTKGKRRHGRGSTRDISMLGVFVLTKNLPPTGAGVRLEVLFRGHQKFRMRTQGEAIRIHERGRGLVARGFAATTKPWTAYDNSSE